MPAKALYQRYCHFPDEFPVLSQQTHRILRNGRIASERININENLIHYLRDTAQLISMIDGSIDDSGKAFDHVVYLDK